MILMIYFISDPSYSVIQECTKKGVVISIGHSVATLKQAESAIRSGARLITHLFNAMTVFHHRADPGIMGAITSKKLGDNPVYYGLIADGIHTHPTALRMAVRSNMKSKFQILLIYLNQFCT